MLGLTFTVVFLSFPASTRSMSTSVNLTSSLHQPYLCPNDQEVTFTCTCAGSDLVWMVNDVMFSYNSIAVVGALRSNYDSSITSALISMWGHSDNGFAYRRSVLTITAQPGAVDPVTVVCHNGSTNELQQTSFIPASTVPNLTVTVNTNEFREDLKAWTIDWQCGDPEVVDYYKLWFNDDPPSLLKNNTAQILVPDLTTQHTAHIIAVDRCGQEGPSLPLQPTLLNPQSTTLMQQTEFITSTSQNMKEIGRDSTLESISAGTNMNWQATITILLSFLVIIGS